MRWIIAIFLLIPQLAHSAEIIIGVEYAMPGVAKTFAELGVPAFKGYPDELPWGKMQPTKEARIDFNFLDRLVKEYQDAGFRHATIVLKAKSPWASRDNARNYAPKPEHWGDFEKWVKAVVERYDHDGKDDMPGLKYPIRYYELGSEFSTFEPTPTPDYLETLERAHKAAHSAYDRVVFMHAAFLTTSVFKDHPAPDKVDAAFAELEKRTNKRILFKSLGDIRAVLDKHKFFDAVNFRALGDAYEIEDTAAWLRWEMKQRKIDKPLIITDTMPSPLIAWGPATIPKGLPALMGIVLPPATENDRPRVAEFFKKLVAKDSDTLAWTHSFVAWEMVKKVVVAAEQKIELINTSFMEDLELFKGFGAGVGVSAWGGMADCKINILSQQREIKGIRPSFYAVGQLQKHIKGYTSVTRETAEPNVRLYRFEKPNATVWIAWVEPGLLLPGDPVPSKMLSLKSTQAVAFEWLIVKQGQKIPDREQREPKNGVVTIPVSVAPVFMIRGK